jgi:hypothetical protein
MPSQSRLGAGTTGGGRSRAWPDASLTDTLAFCEPGSRIEPHTKDVLETAAGDDEASDGSLKGSRVALLDG